MRFIGCQILGVFLEFFDGDIREVQGFDDVALGGLRFEFGFGFADLKDAGFNFFDFFLLLLDYI